MSLYGWVILLSFSGPLALSFDQKVHYYTYWKLVVISIVSVAIPFLVWDEFFTNISVWGFNPRYLFGIYLGHLPLEEVLFFLVVPYNCLFVHQVLKAYFPNASLEKLAQFFAFIFIVAAILCFAFYFDKYYTAAASGLTVCYLFLAMKYKLKWFPSFALTFIVCLVPFLIVNGILTGAVTDEPIVWYSEKHIIGPRIFTIPIEDLFYNFSMLFPMVAIFEFILAKKELKSL